MSESEREEEERQRSIRRRPNYSPIVAPCKDCRKRTITCDQTCEEYRKFRNSLDSFREREKQRKESQSGYDHEEMCRKRWRD